jgi:hypothetical protein
MRIKKIQILSCKGALQCTLIDRFLYSSKSCSYGSKNASETVTIRALNTVEARLTVGDTLMVRRH